MRFAFSLSIALMLALVAVASTRAEIAVTTDRVDADVATSDFKFDELPGPALNDAAAKATFAIVGGERDRNGGGLDCLNDGRVPAEPDEPAANFFFAAGSDGGALAVDLRQATEIEAIRTYSWHPGSRGPQVYTVYASDGAGAEFDRAPGEAVDPVSVGWKQLAEVDSRAEEDRAEGGQYAVSIANADESLGTFRFLLFRVGTTEHDSPFGHTFFSEIDVVAPRTELVAAAPAGANSGEMQREVVEIDGGKYVVTIETTDAPELTEWVERDLVPVVREWYPKIIAMLPSEDYEAPRRVLIAFNQDYRGVAATGGARVVGAARWFDAERDGEGKGAIVHELVHVVQAYGQARRRNPEAADTPGWLVEGIADYIRWYLYEPESRGCEIAASNVDRARYDGSYRVTANFLNFVSKEHGDDVVAALNTAAREGRYDEELWEDLTGSSLGELGDEWKVFLQTGDEEDEESEESVEVDEADEAEDANALTEEETAAGWKLLFDGESFAGWHSFGREDVRPGWKVEDGELVCADPHDAGDLCTDGKYDWFELELEYKISRGGNSGIMFHVTDEEPAAWATGPEFQLEDNAHAEDPTRCGWLYALYQPPNDEKTGKPLDATKPFGEWNRVRLLISPEKCEHAINGVKYFEYVLGSEDFLKRVAASKFGAMPRFAKSDSGYVALQGDHGQVSFRNIKIREVGAER
jgi:hypothetical protein